MEEYIFKPEFHIDKVCQWMTDFKLRHNVKGVVLGLSGGKDSTVVAMFAKKVFGDNIVAVLMPNGEQKDIDDSIAIANQLKLRYRIVNIEHAFTDIINSINENTHYDGQTILVTEKSKTNIAPRIRMTALYAFAQSLGYLVMGTGNYSEAMIGWTTKFGDSACDFNPLGQHTCTEVIEMGKILAKEFGLDEKYIVKKPSDGLTGKTDEENFGFTYEELDKFIRTGICDDKAKIDKFFALFKAAEHKRRMPALPLY